MFISSFSEKNVQRALFTFFSLLILGGAFLVFADNIVGSKNIFQDSDQDGLSNDEEKLYGTNPNIRDTDGDGYSDGIEVESGYDPLKPAPGDKIVKPVLKDDINSVTTTMQDASENLTQKTSQEIANILKNTNQSGQPISSEDVDASVQKVLGDEVGAEEIILPEIDTKDIKIKKGPAKNLSDEKRKKQEREDILEYLTVIAYIVANNSPREFHTEDDFGNMLTNIAKDSATELTSGNMGLLNQLSKQGEKIMEELKNIEVPEKMFDTHIKVLKTAKYAMQLKGELGTVQNDPMGQIATLAKAQGFLGNIAELTSEINKKLTDYGIEKIPLNL
jgi:hypothetical protein